VVLQFTGKVMSVILAALAVSTIRLGIAGALSPP